MSKKKRGAKRVIDIETEDPEFSAWRWVELDSLPKIIVPFKRQIYRDLVSEFRTVVEKIGRSS